MTIDMYRSVMTRDGGFKNHLVWAFLRDNRFGRYRRQVEPYAEKFEGDALIWLATTREFGEFALTAEQEQMVTQLGKEYGFVALEYGLGQVDGFSDCDMQSALDEFLSKPRHYIRLGLEAREAEDEDEAERLGHGVL